MPWIALIFALIILVLLLRPAVDELWTVLQIIKIIFIPKVDLKKRYGDWAVVTGCTDGIGKAYTFQLASRGINVVLISRNPEKLRTVAVELTSKYGIQTKVIAVDFSHGQEVYEDIKKELQGMDIRILVNNVGTALSYPKYFLETTEDEIRDLIRININSCTFMTHMVLPEMIKQKRGAIVNLSSSTKIQPVPLMSIYASTKVFIDYFTEALRKEYQGSYITFQVLCPFLVSDEKLSFTQRLRRGNLFVPSFDIYAQSAINTLGIIDNTTGYWPHRFAYLAALMLPVWLRSYFGHLATSYIRKEYLKESLNVKVQATQSF